MDTDQHLIRQDYDRFVARLAANNYRRDGSSPWYVATSVVVGVEHRDGEQLLWLDGYPYIDGRRVWPMEVIQESARGHYPFPADYGSTLREIAVTILTEDLVEHYNQWGWGHVSREAEY